MRTPSADKPADRRVDFFRTLSESKGETVIYAISPGYRRRVGVVLGMAIALLYGVVSQVINTLLLPGVPLAQPPAGLIGNLAIYVVSGAAIGLVCATPERSTDGLMRGSAVSVVVIIVHWFLTNPILTGESQLTFTSILGLFVLFITAIPAMMLLRLAIDIQVDTPEKPIWSWERIRIPLGILALVSVAGAFTDLQALIQSGLAARNSAELPPALRETHGVSGFLAFATDGYTLEQSSDFELLHDLSLEDEPGNAILVAVFPRGGILACAYSPLGERLRCKSYVTAKFFQRTG